MKLLVLMGNLAVGKMTVGQELEKITDLRLFHNHIMYELMFKHFGDDFASDRLKDVIYEEFPKSDLYGLIVTVCVDFDSQPDWEASLNPITKHFKEANADIFYVELVASQEIRLQRNKTENRLLHKPTKRDIEKSDKHLIDVDKKVRLVSDDGEILLENYIKIDNSSLSPDIVAKMIKEKFSL
jgi:hypothetical protein